MRVVALRPDATEHDAIERRIRETCAADDAEWEAGRAGRELAQAREERGPLGWWLLKWGAYACFCGVVTCGGIHRHEENAARRAAALENER